MSIIGDSYTGGSPYGGRDSRGWPALAAKQLSEDRLYIDAGVGYEGGAGYVHPGNRQGGVFGDQIPKVVRAGDQLVVFFGSRNDKNVPNDLLGEAIGQAFSEVRAAAPSASLLVVGAPWLTAEPPREILRNRDILRAEALAAHAHFVDPIDEGWFVDEPELIGPDGVHPTDDGHAYMARKMAPLIAEQLDRPSRWKTILRRVIG